MIRYIKIAVIMGVFAFFVLDVSQTSFLFTNKIQGNVVVANVDIGELTTDEAKEKLETAFRKLTPITASYKDRTWQINPSDIDLTIDFDKTAEEAYKLGREGNILFNLKEGYHLSKNEIITIPAYMHYNQDKLYKILSKIALSIDKEPLDGQIKINDSSKIVEIMPHMNGLKVDITKTMSLIASKFSEQLSFSIDIAVIEITPKITSEHLSDIDGLLASYTTSFNIGDRNRAQNIIIAAAKTNNILIKSSEIFSFNDKVGLRLAEYGFLEAPGYINGELVPDWGGGVCQVSSTLYNAVLLAGLGIEERVSHFRPPEYVPMGQDATVADKQIDFKFKNTLPQSIYITSLIKNGILSVNIYGKRLPNQPEYQVVSKTLKILEPKTITISDPNLPSGKKIVEKPGEVGWIVTAYRIKKINGEVVNKEQLSVDEFPPINRFERVGTKLEQPPALFDTFDAFGEHLKRQEHINPQIFEKLQFSENNKNYLQTA